mmetsp:Transcript_7250/g.10612  ORF Transcript_7250/g.10612 Transcript_7250/m.10612 type:complete len:309 (+) Transcript_7250:135-1061(+)
MQTRWEEFRQRSSGQKRVTAISSLFFLLLVYFFLLLRIQTQQSFHHVATANLHRSQDEWMERYFHSERKETAGNMNRRERQNLRNYHKEALKVWKHNRTIPVQEIESADSQKPPDYDGEGTAGAIDSIFTLMLYVMIARAVIRVFLLPRLQRTQHSFNSVQNNNRNASFRSWVRQLNDQREAQGERPLSAEALRIVLQERDVNDGTDYDGLLDFQEQSGAATSALSGAMGATDEEIERLPSRVLKSKDDLLQLDSSGKLPDCAICLESFQVGDHVRTIPCFHSFHKACIDPWLRNKSECPVCKHSAIS